MRIVGVVLTVALIALALILVPRWTDPAPEQEAGSMTTPEHRVVDIRDVLVYAGGEAASYRVRTARDVLPGGLAAAMTPVMVHWPGSDVTPGGALVLGNISHGGNPLAGVTLLRTARVHPEKLTRVQFITVPLGGAKAVVHGQLRFVFADGGIELLGRDTDAVGEAETIDDLVFSWEAWRPPGVEYDIMTGLDPTAYELGLRCYSGPQRFLEDTLAQRPWTAYELKLPGGRRGLAELLRVVLVMGDGAARQVIGRWLERAEEAWREADPTPGTDGTSLVEDWLRLQESMRLETPDAGDRRLTLSEQQSRYQSLLRSCATMALYNIDVAVARLLEDGVPDEGMRTVRDPELLEDPAWMVDLADAGWGKLLVSAPRALGFLRRNPWIVPGNVPRLLDDAGLLVHEDGKRKETRYSLQTTTPWGHRDQLLIR
ncbi:hypothetical protein GF314_06655 [bacterium]|nr:hypothetical protein [bacterium]